MSVIGASGSAGGNVNSAISFTIPAILIVAAGVALILYQHSVHTGFLVNLFGAKASGAATASLASMASGNPSGIYVTGGPSPASGITSPVGGRGPAMGVFSYMPSQPGT